MPSVRAEVGLPAPGQNRWNILTCLTFLSFAEAVIAFHQTLLAMMTTWYTSRTFSHGFLVFPLSAYLVWRRRRQLADLQPTPNLRGLLPLGGLCILWVLGNIAAVKLIEELAFVGILVTLVWTFLGSAVVSVLALPLTYLIFAVPFGLGLIGPLQDITAWFAVHALTLSGIPAVLENRILSVPTTTWTVAEACSGIRYLFSSVMLGVIYAWTVYHSRKRRLLFLSASVLTPIVANGLRAYGIVLLAYLTSNRFATDVDHVVYGWLFFTVIQLALCAVGLLWREGPPPQEIPPSQGSIAGTVAPRFSRGFTWISLVLTVLLLGVTPMIANQLWRRVSTRAAASARVAPSVSVTAPWQARPAYDGSWTPELPGKTTDFVQSYVSGQRRVDLYVAAYSGGRGFELLNSYNRVSNPKTWLLIADTLEYHSLDGKRVRIRQSLIQSGGDLRLVWTWYKVAGESTVSPDRVKFLQTKARLMGDSAATSVVAISTTLLAQATDAEAVLQDFVSCSTF
jgi:exosortase A